DPQANPPVDHPWPGRALREPDDRNRAFISVYFVFSCSTNRPLFATAKSLDTEIDKVHYPAVIP
ncbi:MAG TPA: hypothetical protein VN829_04360, partial [Dongiaceae bacterium]|nr:hypothetical protein [Dongiaceae bacterium]